MESKYNIGDWLTRGRKPNEIYLDSTRQNGPSFLELPESEWPINTQNTDKGITSSVNQNSINYNQTFQSKDGKDKNQRRQIFRFWKTNQSDSQNFDDVPKKTDTILQTRGTVTNSK